MVIAVKNFRRDFSWIKESHKEKLKKNWNQLIIWYACQLATEHVEIKDSSIIWRCKLLTAHYLHRHEILMVKLLQRGEILPRAYKIKVGVYAWCSAQNPSRESKSFIFPTFYISFRTCDTCWYKIIAHELKQHQSLSVSRRKLIISEALKLEWNHRQRIYKFIKVSFSVFETLQLQIELRVKNQCSQWKLSSQMFRWRRFALDS